MHPRDKRKTERVRKILLMGASGSGKTSMRTIIFNNNPVSMTNRLGATLDVEQNRVRFLGDLILNLWDCGGQDHFMDAYLNTERTTIFENVGVMIYVFDVQSRNITTDLVYYKRCLDSLRQYSPSANVFLLVHKMDLVQKTRVQTLEKKRKELVEQSGDVPVTVFGTTIYDDTLYRAWSSVVHTLIPNALTLTRHLTVFGEACGATEVVLLEKVTFLVIAASTPPTNPKHSLNGSRYEKTSEIIKEFKYNSSKYMNEFKSFEMELPEYKLIIREMTKNTFVMVVCHDPRINLGGVDFNIERARPKFELLQDTSATEA